MLPASSTAAHAVSALPPTPHLQFQMVSLLQIAEDMLRRCSTALYTDNLSLFIPDSLLEQNLAFKAPVILYVSSHNSGASDAAEELQLRFADICATSALELQPRQPLRRRLRHALTTGLPEAVDLRRRSESNRGERLSVSNTQGSARPTHFLLYLNKLTFTNGDALAQEVRAARAADVPITMIHEQDKARGGCVFDSFLETTPKDLIRDGLYHSLAIAFVSGDAHRLVSLKLFARSNLGAEVAKRREASVRLRKTITSSRSSVQRLTHLVSRRSVQGPA
jgi:hypothetical protein